MREIASFNMLFRVDRISVKRSAGLVDASLRIEQQKIETAPLRALVRDTREKGIGENFLETGPCEEGLALH